MSMELIIKTPEDAFLKAVEFNYAELKTAIENSLEKYKGLTYDDSQVVEAKKDRSTLNKFKESMENERKRVKKLCMRAYEESFEPKVKELVALVNAPINEIDTQVKAFEEKKKAKKDEEIRAFYAENAKDILMLVPYEKAFSEKWLNVSTSMKAVQDEILALVEKVKIDLSTIDKLVLHQANKFMLNTIRKVCVLPKDKFYVNLASTGNTVSSTVLIAPLTLSTPL